MVTTVASPASPAALDSQGQQVHLIPASVPVSTQACPNGQGPFGEPQNITSELVSPETCACLPGYGGGAVDKPCQMCPPGTFSEGFTWAECQWCPAGTFSAAKATNIAECITSPNFCPPGMYLNDTLAQTREECVCIPGFGTAVSLALLPPATICALAPFLKDSHCSRANHVAVGVSGPAGATSILDCQNCPIVSRHP